MSEPNDNLRERLTETVTRMHDRPGGSERFMLDSEIVDALLPFITQACNDARLDEHERLCEICLEDCRVWLESAGKIMNKTCDRRKQLEEGK